MTLTRASSAPGMLAPVPSMDLPRAALVLVIVIVGAIGLSLRDSGAPPDAPRAGVPASPPSTTPVGSLAPIAVELPSADGAGEDLARLPRHPGSVRTGYAVSLDDRFRRTVVRYLADDEIDAVRAHFQRVIVEHGWERADIGYDAGAWSYVLVDGSAEALVEIRLEDGLVRVELQHSDPLPAPSVPVAAPTQAPGAGARDGSGDGGSGADGGGDGGSAGDDDDDESESDDDESESDDD